MISTGSTREQATCFGCDHSTPADGPGEFVNTLDPLIRVYDAAAAWWHSDDNSAPDGRNAQLELPGPRRRRGHLLHRGASPAGTSGEYSVSIVGPQAPCPRSRWRRPDPADGTRLRGPLTDYTVDFNDLVLLTTLSADDLTFNGIAATGVTIVDGDTAIFMVPAGLGEGTVGGHRRRRDRRHPGHANRRLRRHLLQRRHRAPGRLLFDPGGG